MPIFDKWRYDRQERKKIESIEEGVHDYFKLIDAYTPRFRTFDGGVYEMELTRAAIDFKAKQISKARPLVKGSNNERINRILQFKPNDLMDTKKYLYRLSTVTSVKNNCYICPLYDYEVKDGKTVPRVIGFYPLHPDKCELKKDGKGALWMTYEFTTGEKGAIELSKLGRLNRFQNKDELFGDGNNAMLPTLQMMDAQNQAITEAVKNSANIKFLAKLQQSLRQEDVDKERERFTQSNLRGNKSSVMLIDAKYADVKQLESKQFTIDDKQMQLIRENVFDYFGVSENLLQSKFTPDEYNAYYEAEIEPFLIELNLVHTNMLFTEREIAFGNRVVFTSNRMNALPLDRRVNLVQVLFDRGLLTPNEARECLDMDLIDNPDADKFFIRKEYTDNYENSEELGDENNDTDEQNKDEE